MLNKNGTLAIRAYTAGGALPISFAVVRIFGAEDGNKGVVYSLLTDEDGITERINLPAPPRELSETPETAQLPYSVYNIEIEKQGYYPKKLFNVPVFEGINSEQPVPMIPYSDILSNYPQGNINIDTEYK